MILIDNAELCMYKKILYCENLVCMCSLEVKLTLFRSYCSPMYGVQLWWNYKTSTLNRLHIAYHNSFKLFIGMSTFESTSLLCTVFDVQCCQSLLGIWHIDLCVDLIALLTIF